jgi:hypothetical protein
MLSFLEGFIPLCLFVTTINHSDFHAYSPETIKQNFFETKPSPRSLISAAINFVRAFDK